MSSNQARNAALTQWLLSNQGKSATEAFKSELDPINPLLNADTFLQLGGDLTQAFLPTAKFTHRWIINPQLPATLCAELDALPFENQSIDCLFAPLTLGMLGQGIAPLDEWDRVLKPGGFMLIWDVNPWSIWRFRLRSFVKPLSVYSIKRAMLHREYLFCHMAFFYYLPPFKSQANIDKWDLLNTFGKMVPLMPAGFYCLVFQKQCDVVTPLKVMKEEFIEVAAPLRPIC